jgi:hypothetical protein
MNPKLESAIAICGAVGAAVNVLLTFWFKWRQQLRRAADERALAEFKARLDADSKGQLAELTAIIESKNQSELSELKHQLDKLAAEHSFRFSHIFVRVADSVEKTYNDLNEIHAALNNYTLSPEDDTSKDALCDTLRIKIVTFHANYSRHRIYFTHETRRAISLFVLKLEQVGLLYSDVNNPDPELFDEREYQDKRKTIMEILTQLGELRSSVEDEFQKLLGFESADNINQSRK